MQTRGSPQESQTVSAQVTGVFEEYAVTIVTDKNGVLPDKTCVTFSLQCWQDEDYPLPGQIVRLQRLRLFRKGWRSLQATPEIPRSYYESSD